MLVSCFRVVELKTQFFSVFFTFSNSQSRKLTGYISTSIHFYIDAARGQYFCCDVIVAFAFLPVIL